MKKGFRRAVSLLLAVVLIGTCAAVAFAKETKKLVVLGDSNATGFGLPVYEQRTARTGASSNWLVDGERIPGSYVDLVTKAIGATELVNHAHCGWRTNEILAMLESNDAVSKLDSKGTYLCGLDFANNRKNEFLKDTSELIKSDVADADVILLNFGSNDIYTQAINQTNFEIDLSSDPIGKITATFDEFRGNIRKNAENYVANLEKAVKKIRDLNPNATVVIVGIFCPVSLDITVRDTVLLDVKTFMDKTATDVKGKLQLLANQQGCIFADVSNAMCNSITTLDLQEILNEDLGNPRFYTAIKMVHPNEYGHKYIANQIIKALNEQDIAPAVSATYSALLKNTTLDWTKVKGALSYRIYRSTAKDGNYQQIGVSLNTTFYDLLALRGKTYFYRVAAVVPGKAPVMSQPIEVIAR